MERQRKIGRLDSLVNTGPDSLAPVIGPCQRRCHNKAYVPIGFAFFGYVFVLVNQPAIDRGQGKVVSGKRLGAPAVVKPLLLNKPFKIDEDKQEVAQRESRG